MSQQQVTKQVQHRPHGGGDDDDQPGPFRGVPAVADQQIADAKDARDREKS